MITYIYTYRNRDIERVKRSLESLNNQEDRDFKVIFIDYGSTFEIANSIEQVLSHYPFLKYIYTYTQGQPWNRSKALNIGIRQSSTDYIISADVDMIFHSTFNRVIRALADKNRVTFFQVGYLSEKESYTKEKFEIESLSNKRAKGISLYPKSALEAINGFDEFFVCWGSEDEDVINRLKLYGLEIEFYTQNILVYHQYHKPFKELKNKLLSEELSYDQVRFHNDKKRRLNVSQKIIKVNENKIWGAVVKKPQYEKLVNTPIFKTLTSYKTEIDFFLFYELNHLGEGYWGFKFVEFIPEKNINLKSVLYRLWTIRNNDLRAKGEYSLKEVNDLLLKFLLYQNIDFHLHVDLENACLELRINNSEI